MTTPAGNPTASRRSPTPCYAQDSQKEVRTPARVTPEAPSSAGESSMASRPGAMAALAPTTPGCIPKWRTSGTGLIPTLFKVREKLAQREKF